MSTQISKSQYTWSTIAGILVDHSTGVQKGDNVLVIMRETESFPAARAVTQACFARGARVQTLFYSMLMQRDLLKTRDSELIGWVPVVWREAMAWADVCIDLRGSRNLAEFSDLPPEGIALLRKAEGEISSLRMQGTRWTIMRIPNEAFAQQAGRSLDDVNDQFYRSILQDWDEESRRYAVLRDHFAGRKEVRVQGKNTDLTFSTAGRTYLIDDGHINMPGGEIFTAPVEDSVTGRIWFENPGVLAGVLMEEIDLVFRDGVVVDASARTNEVFLHSVLEMDTGARRVGEFGIGTNREINSFTNDILLDEKIIGTVHFALGRSYPECGGKNASALHWDIVKDLRREGSITVDGSVFFRNGSWTVDW